jgi:hypothetical protein
MFPRLISTRTHYVHLTRPVGDGQETVLLDETIEYSTDTPGFGVTGSTVFHSSPSNGSQTTENLYEENKTFVFYQKLTSYSGKQEQAKRIDDRSSISGGSGTRLETSSRLTLKRKYLSENNIVDSTNISDFKSEIQRTSSGSTHLDFKSTTEETEILSCVSGIRTHSYRRKKTTTTIPTPTSNSIVTTDVDVVSIENSKPLEQISKIPYQKSLDSIKPILGATLKGKNYYLVSPSTKANPGASIYAKEIWSDKRTIDYAKLPNVYDNPDPTKKLTKVPVWKIVFNENSFELAKDEVATVLPLLPNPRIIAASYYPLK